MSWSHSFSFLLSPLLLILVRAQYKHPFEAAPIHYDEDWSHYDKCHFFDPRNRFWDFHHCEYVDCSHNNGSCTDSVYGRWPVMTTRYSDGCVQVNGSCTDSVYGRWPVMTTRYSDGCVQVHIRVPLAPTTSCWKGKTMTLCCTFKNDPSRIVRVKPFHMRNISVPERYWPYEREYDTSVTWGPVRPPVPTYPTPEPYPTSLS